MRFSFIHAADLHIDSPLRGLGAKEAAVAERFAKASRKAVENLVERTLAEDAAFLLVAGDLFDGEWKDFSSGLFFARVIGRLHRAGVPTFLIRGNHDADNVVTKALDLPSSVHLFPSAKAATQLLAPLGVAIHGRSFPLRHVPAEFTASYPSARPGLFNIGLLHTSLDGMRGHETYAACTPADLARFGYDYWALGHIHQAAIVSPADPAIVFPGNIQGRSIRETGPKGAVKVVVDDGRIAEIRPLVLDAARWEAISLDVSDCADVAAIFDALDAALAATHAGADGRPLAVRVTLTGTSGLHPQLVATRDTMLAQARADAMAIADDFWVEQLKIDTFAPQRALAAEPDTLDIESLLDAAAEETVFMSRLDELARAIADKMPREMREDFLSEQVDALRRMKALARDQLVGGLAGVGAAPR